MLEGPIRVPKNNVGVWPTYAVMHLICPAAPVNRLPENTVTNVVQDYLESFPEHFTRFRADSHSRGDGDSSSYSHGDTYRRQVYLTSSIDYTRSFTASTLCNPLVANISIFESSLGLMGLTGVGNVHPTESYEECVEDARRFKTLSECLGSWVEFYLYQLLGPD